MTRALALCRRTDIELVHLEAGLAKPFGECRIRTRRPNRQHASRPQRAVNGLQSLHVIKRVIRLADQSFRAVVDIEQDRIESADVRSNDLDCIGFVNARARIGKALAKKSCHRTSGPGDHGRHQFGHHDPRIRAQHRKRGTEREPHAQSADQQIRTFDRFDSSARQRRKRLFRAAEPAVHQFIRAQHHRKIIAPLHQTKFDFRPRHARGIDLQPRNHDYNSAGFAGL